MEQLSQGGSSQSLTQGCRARLGSILTPCPAAGAGFALPAAHPGFDSLQFVVPGVLSRGNLQLQPYITS